MKYILELEDEPNKEYFGEGNYYRCKQIPYWSISESMRNRLEPYDEADRSVYDGVSEAVRCAMCSNPNKSDRGCDGACSYDEKLYEKIMSAIDELVAGTPQLDSEIPKNALRSECTGCRFVGTYDTEFPCANCVRKNKDYYDSEYTEGSK